MLKIYRLLRANASCNARTISNSYSSALDAPPPLGQNRRMKAFQKPRSATPRKTDGFSSTAWRRDSAGAEKREETND
jgi:hypothetical protein